MLIAVDINAIKEYSLKQDTSDEKTVFLLGQLDHTTRSYIEDENLSYSKDLQNDQYIKMRLSERFVFITKFGLKGWRNFKDVSGFDIEFKTEEKTFPIIGKKIVVSEESLRRLPFSCIQELANKIIEENTLSEEDKKK